MRIPLVSLVMLVALTACGGDGGPAASSGKPGQAGSRTAQDKTQIKKAVMLKTMDFASCLEEQDPAAEAPSACPTFVLQSLDYMQQQCSADGGTLQATPESHVWSLDVDADGKNEVLLDLSENLICYGAPMSLSCGSIGCPFFLYSPRGEGWAELGAINADDAPAIEHLNARTFGPGRFAKTAYRIREEVAHIPALSFTARVGTLLVGSVRLSPVRIGEAKALLLGPLTIEPPFRDRGIGQALIARALDEARKQGHRLVILVGDEPYYGKSGFKPVPKGQITMGGPVDPARLLVNELVPGACEGVSGVMRPDWN